MIRAFWRDIVLFAAVAVAVALWLAPHGSSSQPTRKSGPQPDDLRPLATPFLASADPSRSPPPSDASERWQRIEEQQKLVDSPAPEFSGTIAAMQRETALRRVAAMLRHAGHDGPALEVLHHLIGSVDVDFQRSLDDRRDFGKSAFRLGRFDEALAAFRDAGNENDDGSFAMAGLIHEQRGQWEEAIASYKSAMSSPVGWSDEVLFRRAMLLERTGHVDQALDLLVNRSAAVGRDRIVAVLDGDSRLAPILRVLNDSGRVAELRPRGPIDVPADWQPD